MHNDVTGCVIFNSNKIKYLEMLRRLQTFYQRSYTVILTDLSKAIKKLREKISFHKHFKRMNIMFYNYTLLIFSLI